MTERARPRVRHKCWPESLARMEATLGDAVASVHTLTEGQMSASVANTEEARQLCPWLPEGAVRGDPKNRESQKRTRSSWSGGVPVQRHRSG